MTDDKRDEARARATPSRRTAAGKTPRFVHHPDPKSDPVEFLVESKFPGVRKAEEAHRSTAVNVKTRGPSPSELYSEPSSHPPIKHAGAAAYREELLTKSSDELSELCKQVQEQKQQERLAHQASILSENSVWGKPHTWPSRDPAGYVFLGRAVGEIGKALFGDEWTGDEMPAPLPFMREGRLVTKRLSESEKEAVARWEKVQDAIASAAEAEKLLTAGRPKLGGEMLPFPAAVWNTDVLLPRFHTCQLDPVNPFDTLFQQFLSYPCWIFVTEESLQKLVEGLAHKSGPSSTAAARGRAVKYVMSVVSKPRPEGMSKARLQHQCMAETKVNDYGFRAAWESAKTSGKMDPSWSQAGRPKSSGKST